MGQIVVELWWVVVIHVLEAKNGSESLFILGAFNVLFFHVEVNLLRMQ